MTDDTEEMSTTTAKLGEDLVSILRRMNELGGKAEKAVNAALLSAPDRDELSDAFAGISFMYGENVEHTIGPWQIRITYKTKEGEEKVADEHDGMLALLLINEIVSLNSHWWEKTWPEDAKESFSVNVNCNDVFAWGCSDAENLNFDELPDLYKMWEKDHLHGHEVWCIIKRKELPQRPVYEAIEKAGIWDLEKLAKEHQLKPNHYDGISRIHARHKYGAYSTWAKAQGKDVLPFDVGWWEGWREYIAANPDWYDDAWKAEDNRLRTEWRQQNGYE